MRQVRIHVPLSDEEGTEVKPAVLGELRAQVHSPQESIVYRALGYLDGIPTDPCEIWEYQDYGEDNRPWMDAAYLIRTTLNVPQVTVTIIQATVLIDSA